MSLVLVRIRDGRGETVGRTASWAQPLFSYDDGRALLYERDPGGSGNHELIIDVFRAYGEGYRSEATRLMGSFGIDAALGPNSQAALVGSTRPEQTTGIYILDTRSMRLTRVTEGTGPVTWTNDGWIVYRSGNEIRMTDSRGRYKVLVRTKNPRPIVMRPSS
jgi:hypothetical protein